MLSMIDGLSDREYEALACAVIQLAGASRVKLTPRGGEGGIDFFSIVELPIKCHVFAGTGKPLRIIGQAKKYGTKVPVDRVKELITTIKEVKKQSPSVEHLVPIWFRQSSGPILGWLVAHNGVQSGGITKARNHGIITSDSLDLAEIAALSRLIEETLPSQQRVEKLKSRVRQFLQSN